MVWLMVCGDYPTPAQAKLVKVFLVSAVDHGAQAPFTAKARMLVTFGLSLNSVMANTENMRGDVHGGANEQAVELFHYV